MTFSDAVFKNQFIQQQFSTRPNMMLFNLLNSGSISDILQGKVNLNAQPKNLDLNDPTTRRNLTLATLPSLYNQIKALKIDPRNMTTGDTSTMLQNLAGTFIRQNYPQISQNPFISQLLNKAINDPFMKAKLLANKSTSLLIKHIEEAQRKQRHQIANQIVGQQFMKTIGGLQQHLSDLKQKAHMNAIAAKVMQYGIPINDSLYKSLRLRGVENANAIVNRLKKLQADEQKIRNSLGGAHTSIFAQRHLDRLASRLHFDKVLREQSQLYTNMSATQRLAQQAMQTYNKFKARNVYVPETPEIPLNIAPIKQLIDSYI